MQPARWLGLDSPGSCIACISPSWVNLHIANCQVGASLDCPPRVSRERSHAAMSRCIVHVHQPWTMVSRHRDEPAYSMPFTRTYAHAWATITSGQQVHHSKTSRVWTSYLVGP